MTIDMDHTLRVPMAYSEDGCPDGFLSSFPTRPLNSIEPTPDSYLGFCDTFLGSHERRGCCLRKATRLTMPGPRYFALVCLGRYLMCYSCLT